jgi:hypothetical protein
VIKSCIPARIGTQSSMFPHYTTCYLHPEMPGKTAPRVSRTYCSCCSMGNRRLKSAGLVLLSQQPGPRTPAVCRQASRPQSSHYLEAWFPCACSTAALPSWRRAQELSLPIDLDTPVAAAAVMAPGSPCPNASRPQGLCFTAPKVPSTCYSVPGACYHTPK